MKVVNVSVDMIALFNKNGEPKPIKFRLTSKDGEYITVKVKKILLKNKLKIANKKYFSFRCQSIIRGLEKVYELRYDTNEFKWILFKM
ncbi:MAG: hypothetical protein FH753_00365 [Firmicutes bacterium]|nr:hypothetical protein [Bacillota bacterium]